MEPEKVTGEELLNYQKLLIALIAYDGQPFRWPGGTKSFYRAILQHTFDLGFQYLPYVDQLVRLLDPGFYENWTNAIPDRAVNAKAQDLAECNNGTTP